MNILFFFPGPKYDLAHEFSRRLSLASQWSRGYLFSASPFPAPDPVGNFRFHVLPIKGDKGAAYPLRYWLEARRFARALREGGETIDLVVSYDPLTTGVSALAAARILDAALVVEVNGEFHDPYNYVDMPRSHLPGLRRHLYTGLATYVLRRADGIRLLYDGQLSYYEPPPTTEVLSIFDYVDLRPFTSISDDRTVLLAGFPLYRKGVDLLIDAFTEVAPEFPEWKLCILGYYPDTGRLHGLMAGHPRIVHHAAVPHRDMPGHVGRAGIVVLPSRSEGLGRILLEAAAAGKARVGARVGGIPTVISHERDGLLFPPGDAGALAGALRRLMADDALRSRLGQAARERAAAEFSEECYMSSMSAFLARVQRNARGRE